MRQGLYANLLHRGSTTSLLLKSTPRITLNNVLAANFATTSESRHEYRRSSCNTNSKTKQEFLMSNSVFSSVKRHKDSHCVFIGHFAFDAKYYSTLISNGTGLTERLNTYCAQPLVIGTRGYAQAQRKSDIVEKKTQDGGEITIGQKVAQAGRDVTYTGVIIGGLVVIGVVVYVLGRELFSGNSPNGVYTRAFKECDRNDELLVALGTPLKVHGEKNRRGRARHVSHLEFERDGIKHMRQKFYIQGPHGKGTVQLECFMDDRGKYQFRYIFADLEGYPPRTIVIQDNRLQQQ